MRKRIRDLLKCKRYISITIIMFLLFSCVFTYPPMVSYAEGPTNNLVRPKAPTIESPACDNS